MPFVAKNHRTKGHSVCCVGDICYREYLPLIRDWRKNRRWTTWHEMLVEGFKLTDKQAAKISAFAVLFVKEVMEYEKEKCKENGEVY